MDSHHLLQMTNRIGLFFEAQPDRDQSLADAAAHIRRFWAPGVRQELSRWLHEHDGRGLTPFMAEALGRHPDTLEGAPDRPARQDSTPRP